MTFRLFALTASALLSTGLQGAIQPAAAATPAPVTQAPAKPVISSLVQICRIREAQIIQSNSAILERTEAFAREKEPVRRNELLASIESSQRLLTEAEISWQRMSCMSLVIQTMARAAIGR